MESRLKLAFLLGKQTDTEGATPNRKGWKIWTLEHWKIFHCDAYQSDTSTCAESVNRKTLFSSLITITSNHNSIEISWLNQQDRDTFSIADIMGNDINIGDD